MGTFCCGDIVAGRYLVKRPLGRGGMGEVFLVEDKKTNLDRALKKLHPKYETNKHALARFIREVKASSRLDHPGIVKIIDARHWDGTTFYVMEYIKGKSLRHWLNQRGKLPFTSVVRVLCLIADALSHAHRITIHRDLSPENIMVMADGSVRLLDFGLAKMDDQFKDLTIVGVHLGKYAYMAPEQQLNPAEVDQRADIYPLGVMFFEMLTGTRPKFAQPITPYCPELPPDADDFLARAMATDPNERIQTAAEFRDQLLYLYTIVRGEIPSTLGMQSKWWTHLVPFYTSSETKTKKKTKKKKKKSPAMNTAQKKAWYSVLLILPRLLAGRRRTV